MFRRRLLNVRMNRESGNGVQPREKDWNETRVEITRLLEAIDALGSSIAEDLQIEERKWMSVEPYSVRMFHPNSEDRFDLLLDVFLSIFLRNGSGQALLGEEAFGLEESGQLQQVEEFKLAKRLQDSLRVPSFTDQLTLRLAVSIKTRDEPSGTQDFNPSKLCLAPNQLKEHIMSTKKWKVPVAWYDVPENRWWVWEIPPGGEFILYFPDRDREPPCSMAYTQNIEGLGTIKRPFEEFGCGALLLLQVPIKHCIIPFQWIEIILAQAGFLDYNPLLSSTVDRNSYFTHLTMFINFIGTFAGHWSSRNERVQFLYRHILHSLEPFVITQLHFRYFTVAEALHVSQEKMEKPAEAQGLACKRQLAEILSLALGVAARRFRERRISVFGVCSAQERHSVLQYHPSIYRVMILGEAGTKFPNLANRDNSLRWRRGFEGAIAFQTAVIAATSAWETEWANILDEIDDCVWFQLSETTNSIQVSKWMFDLDFERSSLYFTLLQVLRIFGEYIRTVSDDLKSLSGLFLQPANGVPLYDPRPDELDDIKSNWEIVIQSQKDAEERLLTRLSGKTEEIKSLRDGIFNASSLREANRSTTMNRYVIIFTVVTVLFLPPTFTSTVFALDFLKKDDTHQAIWEYKIATVVISLMTYSTAGICILVVHWKHIKGSIHRLWRPTAKESEMESEDSLDSATVAANGAPFASRTEPVSGIAEHHGRGLVSVATDLESAVGEGIGNTVKKRFRLASVLSSSAPRLISQAGSR